MRSFAKAPPVVTNLQQNWGMKEKGRKENKLSGSESLQWTKKLFSNSLYVDTTANSPGLETQELRRQHQNGAVDLICLSVIIFFNMSICPWRISSEFCSATIRAHCALEDWYGPCLQGTVGISFLRLVRLTRPSQRSRSDCCIAHGIGLTFQG